MAFKVQVGPPQIAIHQGQTCTCYRPGREASPGQATKGLYFLDTRVISHWAIYANGESWELLNGGPISYYAARILLTNKATPDRGRDDFCAHARPHHQSIDQRGDARRPRHYEQQHQAEIFSLRSSSVAISPTYSR